ncbi:hypothetical protein ABT160_04530 [Streptomyces sp. NPDC001941]|uniref:hypothetical protein n=1 Tax=Streptomyces sp. NPDC001941 TaxID=3154659 RepID=UPI003323BB78
MHFHVGQREAGGEDSSLYCCAEFPAALDQLMFLFGTQATYYRESCEESCPDPEAVGTPKGCGCDRCSCEWCLLGTEVGKVVTMLGAPETRSQARSGVAGWFAAPDGCTEEFWLSVEDGTYDSCRADLEEEI